MSGLEMLEKLNVRERNIMVIMITTYGMVETAVKAVKLGAHDYVRKPFNIEEITFAIKKATEAGSLRSIDTELLPEHLPQEIMDNRKASASGNSVSLEGFVIPDAGISMEDVEHALIKGPRNPRRQSDEGRPASQNAAGRVPAEDEAVRYHLNRPANHEMNLSRVFS
jgi:hypothetical protein